MWIKQGLLGVINAIIFLLTAHGSPIHIIKIKMVQIGGSHLRVSFAFYKKKIVRLDAF